MTPPHDKRLLLNRDRLTDHALRQVSEPAESQINMSLVKLFHDIEPVAGEDLDVHARGLDRQLREEARKERGGKEITRRDAEGPD